MKSIKSKKTRLLPKFMVFMIVIVAIIALDKNILVKMMAIIYEMVIVALIVMTAFQIK